MSDTPILPKVENWISTGNLITIVFGLIALATAWGTLQADIRALAQRVDKGESRDDKAAEALDVMKGALIELRADSKAIKAEMERMGRQFDRIENAQRNAIQPQQNNHRGAP